MSKQNLDLSEKELNLHYNKSLKEYNVTGESHINYYREKHPKRYKALYEISQKKNFIEKKEIVYIKYLNKDKNFRADVIDFKGEDALEKAIVWGKENLSNFNMDMIYYKDEELSDIEESINFYLKNNYPGKIPNITLDGINGALNKALKKELGFALNKEQLKEVHNAIKSQKKTNKKSI